MEMKQIFIVAVLLCNTGALFAVEPETTEKKISKYVIEFNSQDDEKYHNSIPNSQAADFLAANAPMLDCPDKELERSWYFRWWTYRKHIRHTEDGYVVTEFLPDVPWAKKHNTISCPAAHHIREGRWLRDKSIVSEYMSFWFYGGGSPMSYSFPAADAAFELYKVTLDKELLDSLYFPLSQNYRNWEDTHKDSTGLFWQIDDRDGMEESVSGRLSADFSGYRPTINSYAYADAKALAEMAALAGKKTDCSIWEKEAATIKALSDKYLWDSHDNFYKVVPRNYNMQQSPTRELIGYIPWMYGMADENKGMAWKELLDTCGFMAPFGPAVTERRSPGFALAYTGHECQWNGPSWPFATSQTLTAMSECLQAYGERFFTKSDFYNILTIYSDSHRITDADGNRKRCWIDENINPFTGEWIARTVLISQGDKIPDRGKDYNHSSFCDIIITGLLGIRPQMDGHIDIAPLLPEGQWDWFCLDRLVCQGKEIKLVFDRDGSHYGGKKGFCVYVDGKLRHHSRDYTVKFKI